MKYRDTGIGTDTGSKVGFLGLVGHAWQWRLGEMECGGCVGVASLSCLDITGGVKRRGEHWEMRPGGSYSLQGSGAVLWMVGSPGRGRRRPHFRAGGRMG